MEQFAQQPNDKNPEHEAPKTEVAPITFTGSDGEANIEKLVDFLTGLPTDEAIANACSTDSAGTVHIRIDRETFEGLHGSA